MIVFTLRLLPLLVVGGALACWLVFLPLRRSMPSSRAIRYALVALTLSLAIQLAYPLLAAAVPVPAFPHFLMHVFGLVAAFWLSVFCIRVTDRAPATRVRARAWLLIAALVALAVFYVLGPVRAQVAVIRAGEEQHPFLIHYIAVFVGYLGFALIDVVLVSRVASRIPDAWLRRGIRLLGAGAAVGLLYAGHRALATAVSLPWHNAGPAGVGTYLMLVAIVLMMVGVALPPVGGRYDQHRRIRTRQLPGGRQ